MKTRFLLFAVATLLSFPLYAQMERYIEVRGTSEVEIVPDKIHYIIEIKEYFEEEFDGKSKPEDYRTKVPLARIESGLMQVLKKAGVPEDAILVQEVGDYWRERGHDFLVSKRLDITLTDFKQVSEIVNNIDSRGINSMRIGELESLRMQEYHRQGKIGALKAAEEKAKYLVEALGKTLGSVIRIEEEGGYDAVPLMKSNMRIAADAASFGGSFENLRTIKKQYTMRVRFAILDKPSEE